jgi:threonine dehydratase
VNLTRRGFLGFLGGAAALAALIGGAYKPRPGERVGVLLCGANVDLSALAEIAA